jgi:hypothetical protein
MFGICGDRLKQKFSIDFDSARMLGSARITAGYAPVSHNKAFYALASIRPGHGCAIPAPHSGKMQQK